MSYSDSYATYLHRTKGPEAEREYMERCETNDRITELEAENAALWEFKVACDRLFAQYGEGTFTDEGTYAAIRHARAALRQYEPESQP